MLYHLTIHRMTLVILVVGLLFVGALVFLAGFLVGVGWGDGLSAAAPAAAGAPEEAEAEEAAPEGAEENAAAEAAPESGESPAPSAALPAAAKALVEEPAVPERFAIQVASATTLEDAQAEVERLTARGYKPYVVAFRSTERGLVLRSVRLGPFPSRRKAVAAAARFEADEGRGASVVRDETETRPPGEKKERIQD